ncbi:MAG: hypothetical protein IM600_17530 [Bacteroidetes bacterium]|nr:hypothetical protein [Bacteroidota bacterium]MCA6445234.1 hypothetical protein [Bacteroidota bacterium]
MLRQITILIFLTALLIIASKYILFQSYLHSKKVEFRQASLFSQDKIVQKLVIPIENLYKDVEGIEWKDKNKEVIYKGYFFEVIKIESKGNLAELYLVEDKQENSLFAAFIKDSTQQDDATKCIHFFMALNFLSSNKIVINANFPTKVNHFFNYHFRSGVMVLFEIIKPPKV